MNNSWRVSELQQHLLLLKKDEGVMEVNKHKLGSMFHSLTSMRHRRSVTAWMLNKYALGNCKQFLKEYSTENVLL